MNTILIKPLVTEKSMQDAASGRFTFAVDIDANKNANPSPIDSQLILYYKTRQIYLLTTATYLNATFSATANSLNTSAGV